MLFSGPHWLLPFSVMFLFTLIYFSLKEKPLLLDSETQILRLEQRMLYCNSHLEKILASVKPGFIIFFFFFDSNFQVDVFSQGMIKYK